MRKIIGLLLCAVMCCLLLVGCAEEDIGADLGGYYDKYQVEVRDRITLDFYIITGDGTTETAITSVTGSINTYLENKYNTSLDVHFIKESDYNKADGDLATALAASGADKADIVLINSKAMFDSLYSAGSLLALNSYFNSTDFGRLNNPDVINSALLSASEVKEEGSALGIRYVVPNNRVVGDYEYVMVNKEIAHFLNFSDEKIKTMTRDSEHYNALIERLVTYRDTLIGAGYTDDDIANCVLTTEDDNLPGQYLDRNAYIAAGYECIATAPVISAEEAHASSFGVIKQEGTDAQNAEHYKRCMEVIYSINTDVEFRNLLQYGVVNTHYSLDEDDVATLLDMDDPYEMNMLYTGNAFIAYYNTITEGDNVWNEELAIAGDIQNKESIAYNKVVTPAN